MKRAFLIFVMTLGGCGGLFGDDNADGGSTMTTPMYGYGKPTLEVTINGVHFGPAAPNSDGVATLVNQRDAMGRVVQSTFSVVASSSVSGASCQLGVTRFGPNGVQPISAAPYQLVASDATTTPDGTVLPQSGGRVAVTQGSWSCAGATCNGGVLALSHLDADYAEGYLGVAMPNDAGMGVAQVVCSFYLPTRISSN